MLTSAQTFLRFSICLVSKSEEHELAGNPKTMLGVFEVEMREGVPFPSHHGALPPPHQLTSLQRDFFLQQIVCQRWKGKISGTFTYSKQKKSQSAILFSFATCQLKEHRSCPARGHWREGIGERNHLLPRSISKAFVAGCSPYTRTGRNIGSLWSLGPIWMGLIPSSPIYGGISKVDGR